MDSLKSGFYLIKNNKPIKITLKEAMELQTKSIRFISKDFDKVELDRFNNCLLSCSITPMDCIIEINGVVG